MDRLKRRQKIEALLANWFESEGWRVNSGVAVRDVGPGGARTYKADVDLSGLADSLESQLERALT